MLEIIAVARSAYLRGSEDAFQNRNPAQNKAADKVGNCHSQAVSQKDSSFILRLAKASSDL